MNYENIIQLINRYEDTSSISIKNNLYELLQKNHLKITFLMEKLSISKDTAKYYINSSNKSGKIPFKQLLQVCNIFDISIDEMLKENKRPIGITRGRAEKWDIETKQAFINDVETLNIIDVAKKYNIKEMTVGAYYKSIKRGFKSE